MLVDPTIEQLLPRVENRYTLAITIARRTRQLVDGAKPLVEESENPNLVTLACEELAADKIYAVPEAVDPYIPMRPEVTEMNNSREDDDEADMLPTNMTPVAEEPVPAPVSKIRVMDPDEVFDLPSELAAAAAEEEAEAESEEDEEADDSVPFTGDMDEDEEIVSDDDLENIDGSIDDMPEDEDEEI